MTSEAVLPTTNRNLLNLTWDLIRRPKAAFRYLRENGGRSWIAVALLVLALTILPVVVAAPITAREAEEAIRLVLEQQAETGQTISPEMQQQATQFSTNPIFTVIFPSIMGIIGLLLTWLVWSGALHLLSTMLGGAENFKQMWQAVVWSWVPIALRGLLQTVTILVTGETIKYPGLSGLVMRDRAAESMPELLANMPTTGEMVASSLLSRIDLFAVWNVVLLVLAVMVTARISGRKATLIVVGVWVVLALLGLIPVLISSAFSFGFTG